MEGININEELDNRLQELIESHVSSLRADFRRLIGELPLHVDEPGDENAADDRQESLSRLKESVDARE